jgi:hypothetical protein
MTSHNPRFSLDKGAPPATSYWLHCDRAELARRVAERRHQQQVPTATDFDPTIAATASLYLHKAERRLRQRKASLRGRR